MYPKEQPHKIGIQSNQTKRIEDQTVSENKALTEDNLSHHQDSLSDSFATDSDLSNTNIPIKI